MRCQDATTNKDHEKCYWVIISLIDRPSVSRFSQLTIDVLHNLAPEAPRISYLPNAFRLAVANDDGSIFIYDMKNCSRIFVRSVGSKVGRVFKHHSHHRSFQVWEPLSPQLPFLQMARWLQPSLRIGSSAFGISRSKLTPPYDWLLTDSSGTNFPACRASQFGSSEVHSDIPCPPL